jgi:hypothetical protein
MAYTYLQKPCNALTALIKRGIDVTRDSIWGWDLHIRSSSSQEFLKLSILDNRCRVVIFCNPLDEVGTVIYTTYINLYVLR